MTLLITRRVYRPAPAPVGGWVESERVFGAIEVSKRQLGCGKVEECPLIDQSSGGVTRDELERLPRPQDRTSRVANGKQHGTGTSRVTRRAPTELAPDLIMEFITTWASGLRVVRSFESPLCPSRITANVSPGTGLDRPQSRLRSPSGYMVESSLDMNDSLPGSTGPVRDQRLRPPCPRA